MLVAAVRGKWWFTEWLSWHFGFQGYSTTSMIYNIPKGPPNSQLQPIPLRTQSTLPEPVHLTCPLTPNAVFPLARPCTSRPPGMPASPLPRPSRPLPIPPRPLFPLSPLPFSSPDPGLIVGTSFLLRSWRNSYPDTRSPGGLGARDSASLDQGSFQAPALRLPEPRSPALFRCHGNHAAGGGGRWRGVSRKQSPYRNPKLATPVPAAVASRRWRFLRTAILEELVLEEFEVEHSLESLTFLGVEKWLRALRGRNFWIS